MVGLINGDFRANLEGTGPVCDKEIEMIRLGHQLDLFTSPYVLSEDNARAMAEAGAEGGEANVGRTARRPVYPISTGGKRVMLKPCRWVDGERALAAEIARIMSVPVDDHFPDDED